MHVKLSAFYALGDGAPPYDDLLSMLRRVVAAFGPRRLLWGSDCPYQLGDAAVGSAEALARYRASLERVRSLLPAEDVPLVCGGNATRLFFFR